MDNILLFLILLQVIIEICGYHRSIWQYRKQLLYAHMVLIGLSTGFIAVHQASWWVLLLLVLQAFRIFSLLRISQSRMSSSHLRRVTLRSSLVFSAFLLATLSFIYLEFNGYLYFKTALFLILSFVTLRCLIMLATLILQLKRSKVGAGLPIMSDSELPTLTIAIPARNETENLSECLHSLLKSDYDKLEILVLDDCSQDKTSDIIRSFAHKGVRFLKGSPAPNGWLAKNWAYKQLLEAANAENILFCGVDVRFEQGTLRRLVSFFESQELQMMSILPRRPSNRSLYMIWQPMRYWRELTLPKIWRNNYPPALSTVWIANVDSLKDQGGFDAYRQTIRPEYLFARNFDGLGKYRFLTNGPSIDIFSKKPLKAQLQTSLRTRYPELRRRVENVFFSTLLNASLFILPIVGLFVGYFGRDFKISILSVLLFASTLGMQTMIVYTAGREVNFLTVVALPLIAICEIVVEIYSMWAYEFSDVIWKGRNVCLPVLRSSTHLPKV